MKSLGNFLRYARKRSGLTQEQIAERLNIVTPVLSKWENDKAVPQLDLLCKLCNILNISIEECINGELLDEERVLPPENYQQEKLGETLKNLRLKNGWSQAEVGKKMFVTSQTVSKWETGGVSSLEILGKLAELFGLTPTELINGLEHIKENTDKQTAAEQLKKSNRFVFKITAIILAVIIFLGAVTGLIVGLVFKNINDDRQNNEDKTLTEQPDGDNSNQLDDTVKIELVIPVKRFYSAEVSFSYPDSYQINVNKLLFFEVEVGDGVYAVADGTVVKRDLFSIDIDHGKGFISSYSMVETLEIEAGSEIKKGQLLGTTSDSYLGFGLTLNGKPVAPLEYLTELPEPIERPPEHVHEWVEWQSNQTQHWQVCMCGEESEHNSHTFIDNICSVCGYEDYIPSDEIKAEFTVPINSDIFRTYLEDFMATDGNNTHRGIDFSANAGDKIYAVADGEIAKILDRTDYFVISINHGNGVVSVYSGVIPVDGLTEGQEVEKGSVIACVSEMPIYDEQNDGPHLHFGMQLNGFIVNPLDYIPYEDL